MLSVEELLKPRYKVIADYPKSIFIVGDIIGTNSGLIYCDTDGPKYTDYPHLFQRLEWWMDRELEDMPEYVRHTASGKTWKVKEYDLPTGAHLVGNEISSYWAVMKNLVPATESDYNAYLQTTNQNNG